MGLADSSEIYLAAKKHLNAALYEDAARDYATAIQQTPTDADAYYGRVRALLEAHHSADAFQTADLALKKVPDTAPAEAAAGFADIRRGEINSAEKHFRAAQKVDPQCAAAMSGMAEIYSMVSQFAKARDLYRAAYHAAPDDSDAMLSWANTLDGAEHIAALEKVLSILDPTTENAQSLRAHIAHDKAVGDRKLSRLMSPYGSARVKLIRFMDGPNHSRGLGVQVRLNDKSNVKLLLDTGASGIAISPKAAERANLRILSAETTRARGIGDLAPQSSLTYLADEVRAGSVIFADYPIHAFQSAKSPDFDGLIGPDVFSRFIVGIDFPNTELQLEPKRDSPVEPTGRDKPAPGFYRVFRRGNHLLLPAMINGKRLALFLIDSGSTDNMIDTATAHEVSGLSKDSGTVQGIQGKVKQTSRADRISLTFAGFRQDNPNLLAISLEKMSDSMGVGMGGILGMPVLEHMKLTIDYREGTVRFEYKQ